ncbi:patatin-like phospholipase family protein [Paraburkholderia fungorum]|jgi:Patatin-like phospholipase|uniref:patatin-like phospholipase family protein n=1 Tax=Paraburkholderia fungorum TaxID=134537 RepID=UPI00041AF320|nr:patatin-like phospholipase family protein [Paraburkholderia fungorum]
MTTNQEPATWGTRLEPYQTPNFQLFTDDFFRRWKNTIWAPVLADQQAAAELHTQLSSRVTTQALGYLDGVEVIALDSLYRMFGYARAIQDKHFGAVHFEACTWHILNTHVRPFTAKWHRRMQAGALSALDDTDEFRNELALLQPLMARFDELLLEIRDGCRPSSTEASSPGQIRVLQEMSETLSWGIPEICADDQVDIIGEINAAEKAAIAARRKTYEIRTDQTHAAGLALSGGGIRSATFSLGVLIALARRNLLPDFDYLSTVSGGGYLGSFLTAFLSSANSSNNVGLKATQLPFQREGGEAEALRHIRHHSKYLQTSWWERTVVAASQLYGMFINGIVLALFPAVIALAEYGLQTGYDAIPSFQSRIRVGDLVGVLLTFAIVLPVLVRVFSKIRTHVDRLLGWVAGMLLLLFALQTLSFLHRHVKFLDVANRHSQSYSIVLIAAGLLPVVSAAAIGALGRRRPRAQVILATIAAFAAPVFFIGLELIAYEWLSGDGPSLTDALWLPTGRWLLLVAISAVIFIAVCLPLDINFTSPHRHYRKKLVDAFFIKPAASPTPERPFDPADSVKLSEFKSSHAPYHLINAAINVPSSNNPAMQGRLTDFFLFSPSYCGSPLTGYEKTKDWESADPRLDLGTAMAISGAATSPLMGTETRRHLTFWLTLLNIRLGYWLRKPLSQKWYQRGGPGITLLLREMFGCVNENGHYLNVTDGGHIENLGVYELLRRRCKYIVAIDGEHDPSMTFHALTTLQRLAAIDLSVSIEINLDDLRLRQDGLSRTHFQMCRIKYPKMGNQPEGTGYLIYVKLSLTGNEGEFIKRYRQDEPEFPHHSTANQFFTEAQFEAYRSLGEHVGDKLFTQAIIGAVVGENSLSVDEWFKRAGASMLV